MSTTEKPIAEMTLIEIQYFMSTNTTPTDTPETDELLRTVDRDDLRDTFAEVRTLERARDAALRELTELRKDKDRLDWALGNMTPDRKSVV